MKVIRMRSRVAVYSCNVYLVRGEWNAIDDVNTLVDVGPDDFIVSELAGHSTGLGKVPVEQIVLTHNHSDHSGGVPGVKSAFGSAVLAKNFEKGVDRALHDGEWIRMGDRAFQVIEISEHSSDSICLYCPEERVLFSGDTPLSIMQAGETHSEAYVEFLQRLLSFKLERIYVGHGAPICDGIQKLLRDSWDNVRQSVSLIS